MPQETDSLTGLLTRKTFHDKAGRITKTTPDGLALIWFNLDNFKMFNKRFVYTAGKYQPFRKILR